MPATTVRMTSTALIDGVAYPVIDLKIEQEMIAAPSMSEVSPDSAWEHVDPAGHVHAYSEDFRLPTLKSVTLPGSWCEDCEETHEDSEMRCVACDAPVEPGLHRGGGPASFPGPEQWLLRIEGLPPMPRQVSVRLTVDDRVAFGFMRRGQARSGPYDVGSTDLHGKLDWKAR